jgi:surface antigen
VLLRGSLAVLATAATLIAAGSAPAATRGVIVRGYPYAGGCPAGGVADAVDRWKMNQCNCTSYVAWALQANGQRIDWFVAGAMDAWNWPNVARRGHLPLGSRPRVGAVAVWPKLALPFGHVAYVTGIEPDGGIDVSEYNFPGMVKFGYDERDDVSARGAVFIYVPKRAGA